MTKVSKYRLPKGVKVEWLFQVYEEMKKFSGKVGNKRNLWETIYYV